MAHEDESSPLVGGHCYGRLKPSQPGQKNIKRVSSIAKELGLGSQKGKASVVNVGINLAKTAAGTGILALPYACKQGGLLLFVSGMFFVVVWNVSCMKQLCDALEYLVRLAETPLDFNDISSVEDGRKNSLLDIIFRHCKHDRFSIKFRDQPPEGTSSFSKLGWYALGNLGLWSIDIMMLVLLSFINIAFEVAILQFAEATPFTTGEKMLDGLILGLVLVPFCIVDDLSALSKLSRMGLIILGLTMSVVAWYGLNEQKAMEYNAASTFERGERDTGINNHNDSKFNLYPLNGIEGVSKWFGCTVFSFGIVPLTFNFRESMADPEKLPQTAMISMSLVGVCYIVIGVSFLYLFPNIENDLLAEIPSTGLLATTTRIAMILVVMASTPLLIVPCAEIIEGKIYRSKSGDTKRSKTLMIIIRSSILFFTVSIASKLPGFISVLSFVGCFAVSMVSFVLPPGLHWLLLGQGLHDGSGDNDYTLWSRTSDITMLMVGLATTIITTWFTGS
ncbi:unnamed protein product [Pseudo-nitzschia multistriata]|uniref:Amino acid transporter transmembrane domain-containing protein n=1 Tax=Pseudo-nitzschia multistriata TaxID=183589 RepID=A0A448ZGX3_9STRA|nr:unnamed protein product [Pseudo-nitzschia multistriata]